MPMDILRKHDVTPRGLFWAIFFVILGVLYCRFVEFPLFLPFLLLFLFGHIRIAQQRGTRNFLRLGLLLTILVVVAFYMVKQGISPLYVPVASVGVLTVLLFKDLGLSFVMALLSSMLTGLVLHQELDYVLVMFMGSVIGIYLAWESRTRAQLFKACLGIALVQIATVVLLFPFLAGHLTREYTQQFIVPLIWNSLFSIMPAFLLLKGFEWLFGELTNFSLIELSDFNQPLLRRMILEAPGTYHHSLVVSNLSEAAADAIGANGLLARVGAYYHDIGKMEKSEYFTENQIAMGNKHDEIEPSISRLVILNHVRDGIEMGKKHRLSPQIIDFIPQHHGTTLMHYFYRRALEGAQDNSPVKEEEYRYPGPKPQNKETAIVLLADSVEAATRALEEPSPQNVAETVRKVINNKFIDGQLDECNLTLKEIEIIANTFIRILSAMYHTRVRYPDIKNGSPSTATPKTNGAK